MTENVMSFQCTCTYLQTGSLICCMLSQYLLPGLSSYLISHAQELCVTGISCVGVWRVLIVSEQFYLLSEDFLHFWKTDYF